MPAADAVTVDSLDATLREAGRRAALLSVADRARALKLFLAWQLRNVPQPRATDLLRALRDRFAAPTAGPMPVATTPVAAAASGIDPELLAVLFGANADASPTAIHQLRDAVEQLRHVLRKPGYSLVPLLQRAARDLATHDKALDEAARESFDRVLGALDPEHVRKTTPRKTLSTESAYKAALFDALVEKFTQLRMYHDKGRLVRDYKMAYKKHIQDETTKQVDAQS